MPMKFTDIDEAIISLLEINGRISNREVARQLDVSEGTVRARIKKMEDKKALRLGVVCDIVTMGFICHAVVRIKALPECVQDIAKNLAALDSCKFVGMTLGSYDILVYILAKTRIELSEIIDLNITCAKGVININVLEPVGSKKQRSDLTYIV
jgi:DNA-binding Lrp family transcriptional regulator